MIRKVRGDREVTEQCTCPVVLHHVQRLLQRRLQRAKVSESRELMTASDIPAGAQNRRYDSLNAFPGRGMRQDFQVPVEVILGFQRRDAENRCRPNKYTLRPSLQEGG